MVFSDFSTFKTLLAKNNNKAIELLNILLKQSGVKNYQLNEIKFRKAMGAFDASILTENEENASSFIQVYESIPPNSFSEKKKPLLFKVYSDLTTIYNLVNAAHDERARQDRKQLESNGDGPVEFSELDDVTEYNLIQLPNSRPSTAATTYGKANQPRTSLPSMFEILSFDEKPKQTQQRFLATTGGDRFRVINDDFVSENMKQYTWYNYDNEHDKFFKKDTKEMLQKCPRVMTRKVSMTPQIKFSKITDDKVANKVLVERKIDFNVSAGRKTIKLESASDAIKWF